MLKEKLKNNGVALLLTIVIFIVLIATSWGSTCGIVFLICKCFGWGFTLLKATGIWLVLVLISSTISTAKPR